MAPRRIRGRSSRQFLALLTDAGRAARSISYSKLQATIMNPSTKDFATSSPDDRALEPALRSAGCTMISSPERGTIVVSAVILT